MREGSFVCVCVYFCFKYSTHTPIHVKILETAVREKVDMIGLSGLITPSLDEMCNVASEMQKQGFTVFLLHYYSVDVVAFSLIHVYYY